MTPRLLPWLDQLPPYVPGHPPRAVEGLLPAKLSSNESPHLPLDPVLRAAAAALTNANRYPGAAAVELGSAIAAFLDVPADNVCVGPGSVALLQQLVQITSTRGDEVLFAWRSFEAYPMVTVLNGATPVQVPLTDRETHDLDAMADSLSPRTSLVLLCSPNNPTGTCLTSTEFAEFMRHVPPDVLVVIDEAYAEFVRGEQFLNGVQAWSRYPNVAVLRTFSKAFGLAGLRVGYVVAHHHVADVMRRSTVPFTVPEVAQAAAVESLRHWDTLQEQVEATVRERDRVQGRVVELGIPVHPSQANFIWLRLARQLDAFLRACDESALSVRAYGDEGVRITIGEPAANDRVLAILSRLAADSRRS